MIILFQRRIAAVLSRARSLAIFGIMLSGFCAPAAQAYTVTITERELDAILAPSFPLKQEMPLFNVVFSDPRTQIVAGANRLRISVAMEAHFPNQTFSKGRAIIEGDVYYDAEKGEFHLRQPGLVGLEFEQLPQEYRDLVAMIVNTFAAQRLPIIVLYALDEKDFKQSMTRRVLKNITLKDGKMYAELAWR